MRSLGRMPARPSASVRETAGACKRQAHVEPASGPLLSYRFGDIPLRPKLQVGSVDDPLEQQADAMAQQVMRMPGSGKCSACQKEDEETHEKLARKTVAGATARTEAPPIVQNVLREPGQPLEASTRAFFEPRFGHDFGRVRVHADARAAQSAEAVGARAYAVGRDVVFGAGEYNPSAESGRTLLAHELAHTVQQVAPAAVRRDKSPKDADDTIEVDLVGVDPEETKRLQERGINLPQVSDETFKTLKPAPPTPAGPATPPSGFVSATGGAAPCPDAPDVTVIPASCVAPAPVAGSAPPKKETATLPALDEGAFGSDAKVETFATGLADCHAARVVAAEVAKRYKAGVESAKKSATAEAKTDTDKALADATAGIDPKDRKALSTAKNKAAADAKIAAQKKIADAQAAVQKPDIAAVQKELAAKFKDELKADYADTMHAAMGRFGGGWVARMIAAQEKEKGRLTKARNAKPKLKAGETPPPEKPKEEVAAEVEAELVNVRCERQNWAANQIETVKRGWMVGRREKVDFDTVSQKVTELKDFKPEREVPDADRIKIPAAVAGDPKDPGVAPEVAQFLSSLAAIEPNFKAGNYGGHGGGSWAGAGFSVDLTMSGKDAELDNRGFYKHDVAVRFLLSLNQAATAMGGKWRVLYNDFQVAEEVNQATGTRNVTYMGNNPKGTLNWHGPSPMVLHFHLDIELPPPAPAVTPVPMPTPAPAPTPGP